MLSLELSPTRKEQLCHEVGTQRLTVRAQVTLRRRRDGRLQPHVRNLPSLWYGHNNLGTPLVLTNKHSRSVGGQGTWFCCESPLPSLVGRVANTSLQIGWVCENCWKRHVTHRSDLLRGLSQNYLYVGPKYLSPEHQILTRRTLSGFRDDNPDGNQRGGYLDHFLG